MKRGITLLLLSAGIATLMAMPALAQGNKLHVTLTCGETSYEVVVPGNGQGNVWTPAQDNASNQTFHITAFGEISGTFTPADGSEPQILTEPPKEFQAQAQQHNEHPTIDCALSFTTEDASGTFVGTGSLLAWISGR